MELMTYFGQKKRGHAHQFPAFLPSISSITLLSMSSAGFHGAPDGKELERTFGVYFIGYVAAMVGYGFTFFQTYVYYSRYPNDHRGVKATVAVLCLVDTAASALMSQALYFYLVNLFPYTIGLTEITKTFNAEIGLALFGNWVVQMFYAHRLWILSKRLALGAILACTSSVAFGLGMDMTAEIASNSKFSHLAESGVTALVAVCQGLTFLTGLLTFILLCFYLQPGRTPNVKPIVGWFDTIVAYAINRGSVATLIQLGFFITFLVAPGQLYWIPFHFVASKLFTNSLLTMLNTREVVRGQGLNEEDPIDPRKTQASFINSAVPSGGVRFNVVESKISQSAISIEVSRTVEQGEEPASKSLYDNECGAVPSEAHPDMKRATL